jgi:hypothetical protein
MLCRTGLSAAQGTRRCQEPVSLGRRALNSDTGSAEHGWSTTITQAPARTIQEALMPKTIDIAVPDLSGRLTLVTGTSDEIGWHIAAPLARAGADVGCRGPAPRPASRGVA